MEFSSDFQYQEECRYNDVLDCKRDQCIKYLIKYEIRLSSYIHDIIHKPGISVIEKPLCSYKICWYNEAIIENLTSFNCRSCTIDLRLQTIIDYRNILIHWMYFERERFTIAGDLLMGILEDIYELPRYQILPLSYFHSVVIYLVPSCIVSMSHSCCQFCFIKVTQ